MQARIFRDVETIQEVLDRSWQSCWRRVILQHRSLLLSRMTWLYYGVVGNGRIWGYFYYSFLKHPKYFILTEWVINNVQLQRQ